MTICKNAKVNYWAADMDLSSMEPMPYIANADEDDDDDDEDNENTTSSNGHTTNNGNEDDAEELDDVLEQQRAKLERKQKRLDERLQKNPTKDDMVVFKRMNKSAKNVLQSEEHRSVLLVDSITRKHSKVLIVVLCSSVPIIIRRLGC